MVPARVARADSLPGDSAPLQSTIVLIKTGCNGGLPGAVQASTDPEYRSVLSAFVPVQILAHGDDGSCAMETSLLGGGLDPWNRARYLQMMIVSSQSPLSWGWRLLAEGLLVLSLLLVVKIKA